MPRCSLELSVMPLLMCMYRGVVQLFNAVHKQQTLLEGKLAEAGPSERRREKAVQSLTKGRFLDMLKNVKVCICRIRVIVAETRDFIGSYSNMQSYIISYFGFRFTNAYF